MKLFCPFWTPFKIALVFLWGILLSAPSFSAKLTGPEEAELGRLVVFESDIPGDWLVYPPDTSDIAKDSNERTLYFVAHHEGKFTIIFFGVEDSKPVISQTAIQIGTAPVPEPKPAPTPSPVVKLTEREKVAAHAALEAVIDGVENGSIKTPIGARSTFKQTLMAKGQVCDGRSCHLSQNLQTLTDDWTERTDFSSAESVKALFKEFLKEVE